MKYYCNICKDTGMYGIDPCKVCQNPHLFSNVIITELNEYGYPEAGYYDNSERDLTPFEIDAYVEFIYGPLPENVDPKKIGKTLLNRNK